MTSVNRDPFLLLRGKSVLEGRETLFTLPFRLPKKE